MDDYTMEVVDDSAEALTDIEMETEVEMQGVGGESCSEQLEEIEPQPKKNCGKKFTGTSKNMEYIKKKTGILCLTGTLFFFNNKCN